MLTPEQIKIKLEDRNLSKVAQGCGLHYNAIIRFMGNKSKPAYTTVKALSDYLEGQE
jgi:hypothetical protein